MDLSPSGLIEYARSDEGRKQLRYAGVSVIFVPIGQIMIQILGPVFDDYTKASIVSAAILTLPNFFANKYFVWRVTSRENLRSQVLVFWVAAMLGVTLATVLTKITENAMADRSQLVLRISVFIAQLVGFGIVWVGRYLILDKWLFKLAGDDPEHASDDIGEIPI